MAKTIFEEMGGTYTQVGDYLFPNLKLPEEEQQTIGIWGQRHARHLKQNHKVLYMNLLTSGKLNSYLADIDKQAQDMFLRLVKQLAEKECVTEQLKAENQMERVQKMNNITVKVDAGLHAEVKQYIESHGMTMAEFVTLALQDELHPKFNTKEDMGNMRTLAFQVPDDLFKQIKEYLQRNNMTQKEFIIGLIETEMERDMAERERVNAAQTDDPGQTEEDADPEETAAVGDFEDDSDEDESEEEEQGFTMGM